MGSISRAGYLKYHDISTGQIVAEHKTKIRECSSFGMNPWNAMLLTGDNKGCVQMWSPNIGKPLVKILAHAGAVNDLAVDRTGLTLPSPSLSLAHFFFLILTR